MFLTKKAINDADVKINVSFEKVVDDLLMISISSEIPQRSILSYWRLTKVMGIPPLEIGIDCENGNLVNITFYIDASFIKEKEKIDVHSAKGNVVVDTEIFTKSNDYIDIDQTYKINIQEDKLICIFEKADIFKQLYQKGRLEIYVNSKNEIIGFSVCNLLKEEIKMIDSLEM